MGPLAVCGLVRFSPSRLAFRRERRHPLIPAIPVEGGEIEQGRKQQEDKEKEQVRRNLKRGKNVKKPPTFQLGQRVLTQKFTSFQISRSEKRKECEKTSNLPTGSKSLDTEVYLFSDF